MPWPKGRSHSAEARERMSAAHRQRCEEDPTERARLAAAAKRPRRPLSAEHRTKLTEAKRLTRSRIFREGVHITRLGCWEALDPAKRTKSWAWKRNRVLSGPVPPGKQINHRCDNGACFNPSHVYVGTSGQNNQDAHAARLGRPDLRAVPPPDDWLDA